jgi:hypothetical protein
MGKFQELKEYIKNPQPHVIAQVEYRGHLLNAIGILIVCVILFTKGYWYITLAFIFSVMISWSQGMSAYQRYKVFISLLPDETYEYILQDKSFTRKRERVFRKRYKRYVNFIILLSSFIIMVSLLGLNKITWLYTLKVGLLTYLFYWLYSYLLIGGLIIKIQKDKLKNEFQTEINKQVYA